jgi:diacylglycerol kinase family enzyme
MISAGTGNDWIKTSGVPKDAKSAIQLIKTGKKITQNIGKINYTIQDKIAERYFINFAGVGFDAYVVSETKSLKKYGQIAYLLGMIKCLFSYKKPTVKISLNDTQIITPIYMAIAGVGQYGGGGMKLMPSANLTGEDFCFVIIKNIPIWKVILNIGKLYTGTLTTLKEVDLFHTKKIKIENTNSNIPLLMESDGEDIGEGPFEISIINHKINILVP